MIHHHLLFFLLTYGLRNIPTLSMDVRLKYFIAESIVIGTGCPVR
jgi:hypothetical protein